MRSSKSKVPVWPFLMVSYLAPGHTLFCPILYFGDRHHLLLMKVSSEDGLSTFYNLN
ncbi:hypothetical protein GBA52_011103 [Prunus armeniaca]|nr:hypothetical protein GBA52_011103 [Prunus armeniaca]